VPFTVTRPDVGDPLTPQEIADFTRRITGFWKDVGYFQWIVDTSHGVDATTGMRDWMVWWTGVDVVKAGGEVTFYHSPNGGPDNIFIPTSRVLAQVAAGYMLTGDPAMGRIVEQYSKGLSASMLGMVWDDADPVRFIMARAIMPNNHDVTLGDGRVKHLDYTPWQHETTAWNSNTIHVPTNPYWGDIWAKNMRSKDDVPHIYHATALLPYVVACGADPTVRDAAAEALGLMEGFTKDIVDTGYHIRSKDETGALFIPDERYPELDLSTFVKYESLMPNAECTAKLCTALIGYGEARENDCLDGSGGAYEQVAYNAHYYEVPIIRYFHVSAVMHALTHYGQSAAARALLEGLIARIDRELNWTDAQLPEGVDRTTWDADLASFLTQSVAAGVPLTSREARLVQEQYGAAVDMMMGFQYWNPWDPAVDDGQFSYRPDFRVNVEDMAMFLEACWSPFRSESGVMPVDCDVIADPSRWGT
jgi:hypothetical protein